MLLPIVKIQVYVENTGRIIFCFPFDWHYRYAFCYRISTLVRRSGPFATVKHSDEKTAAEFGMKVTWFWVKIRKESSGISQDLTVVDMDVFPQLSTVLYTSTVSRRWIHLPRLVDNLGGSCFHKPFIYRRFWKKIFFTSVQPGALFSTTR